MNQAPKPAKLLDRVREAIRLRHYSHRTEQAYIGWIRRFIVFHDKRHPRKLGEREVAAFVSSLAERRRHHLHESVLQRAVKDAARAAGIARPATCHSLPQLRDSSTGGGV